MFGIDVGQNMMDINALPCMLWGSACTVGLYWYFFTNAHAKWWTPKNGNPYTHMGKEKPSTLLTVSLVEEILVFS